MPLEMKSECQACSAATPADGVAFICSSECTYCCDCAGSSQRCPSCHGELQPRPRRGNLSTAPSMTQQRMAAFNDAWTRADVEQLISFFADDCVYTASIGPEPGATFVGKAEVANGIRQLLEHEKRVSAGVSTDAVASDAPIHIHGHRGFCEWSYPQLAPDGRAVETRGCDYFEFRGNLIVRKDAFIKRFGSDQPRGNG